MTLTRQTRRPPSWHASLAALAVIVAVLPHAAVEPQPVSPIASQQEPKGVVAHWRFQRGWDRRPATDLIVDSSGNDRHAGPVGAPRFRTVKLPGSNLALAFDGNDDRLCVPDHELFYLTKSLTLEAYIKIDCYPASAAELSQIVFRGDNRAGFDPWFLAITESGQLNFSVADALNNGSALLSPEPIPTGRFFHVAGTLDDETGEQSLFINGKCVATTNTKIRACGALGGHIPGIGIGNLQVHSVMAFHGTIDEVRLSSVALAPNQFLPPPAATR